MHDTADAVSSTTPTSSLDEIHIDALKTYLHCPRRYELAHKNGLEPTDDNTTTADRMERLRTAICAALRSSTTSRDDLLSDATDRLATQWADHDERFHSSAQRRHVRRVLEATLEAYVDHAGVDHAAGIDQVTSETTGEVIGPTLPLSSTVSLPGAETAEEAVTVDAAVDYIYADGGSVVGVQFVPTLSPLGLLRYRSDWEGSVADQFRDHFDSKADVFEPGFVGSLFETAVVVDGLRNRCQQLGLEDRTCRYVQIPLADRSQTTVNWVRETVETSLEMTDLTDSYIDHHTYGMTHEHRNRTVDDQLAAVVGSIAVGDVAPTERWESISSDSCPDCSYTVCCQEYLASEVRFDG